MIREQDLENLIKIQKLLTQGNQMINYKSLLADNVIFYPDLDKDFNYYADILINYNLAKEVNSYVADGLKYISCTPLTFNININEIYLEEQNKKERDAIDHKLKENNLKQTEWFLKTKWFPIILSLLSFLLSVFVVYNNLKKDNEIKKLENKIKQIEIKNTKKWR